jgi:hypothetical protein
MDDIRSPIPRAATRFSHLLRRDRRHKGYAYRTEKTYDMPHALARKLPSPARELGWQCLFSATDIGRGPRSNVLRRHHLHDTTLRKHVAS